MIMFKISTALSLLFLLSSCASEMNTQSVSSRDNAWQLTTSGDPEVLTVTARDQNKTFRKLEVEDSKGVATQVSCLFEAPSRLSFFAILSAAQEIWEMSYDPDADPVFPGFVHNYRTGQVEGITVEDQPFARRRLYLELDHRNLIFSPSHTEVIGYDTKGDVVIYNLDSRRTAARLSNQNNVLLSKSRFALQNNELVFILHFSGGKQRVFSAHTWREIEAKSFIPNELITVNVCTE